MGQPLQLTILRQGDTLLLDLAEVGSLIPRSEVRVEEGFLRDLVGELETAGTRGVTEGGVTALRELERIGGLIFSHLLTDDARRHLFETPPGGPLYLRLDEELLQVPWELCHDGEQFLTNKFEIGRQVITGRSLPAGDAPTRQRDTLRVLLVADPTETLPQVTSEAERLCELLDAVPNVDVTLIGGRGVRRIPLLAALGEHDVVHFAGHSHHDPQRPERSGWRLHEGLLTASELSKVRPAPMLVFSNSCEAGASVAWTRDSRYEGHVFGIGSAFLLAGARNYIGTFWVVHDDDSAQFATACYRTLAAGGSVGTALREARSDALQRHGADGLTWASYILYGDPAFVPFDGGSVAEPDPPKEWRHPPPARRQASGRTRYTVDLAPGAADSSLSIERAMAPSLVVGRAEERCRLAAAVEAARSGKRQTVFVSGPAGIGKTTLVDDLAADLEESPGIWLAQGQSVQQYGSSEAYLPLLEAWGSLLASRDGSLFLPAMRRVAPSWLAQFPSLLQPEELEELRRSTFGVTRERMLREMAELVEVVTSDRTVVLVLEDLHWSDSSTLELISYLSQRRRPARMLLVGTYRSTEVAEGDHPLRSLVQELTARGQCDRMKLEPLAPRDVAAYLSRRLEGGPVEEDLAQLVYERTDGHPLFLTNVVDFALREGLIVEEQGRWEAREGLRGRGFDVPDELRELIDRQIDALADEDRACLEAASVAGAEFAVAEVAAALGEETDSLEERCEGLAWKGRFLRQSGLETWPDGTVSGRYRFLHALYADVLYGRVSPARRVRLHARIGERKEKGFASKTAEVAGALAAHFLAAHDACRAVRYHEEAGDVAMARHAPYEAKAHLEQALRLMPELTESPDTLRAELDLLIKLAAPITSIVSWAAPELGPLFERARALSREVPEGPHLFPLLRGVMSFHQVRAEGEIARTVGEELLALAERSDDVAGKVQAHYGHGVTLYPMAELYESERHLRKAIELYDPSTHLQHVAGYGDYDPGASCRCWLSWVEWATGRLDQALATVCSAIDVAEPLNHPFTYSWAHQATAMMHLHRGDVKTALGHLEIANTISQQEGFLAQAANGKSVLAWARLLERRFEEAGRLVREALSELKPTGMRAHVPRIMNSLAICEAALGRPAEAIGLLDDAIAEAEATHQFVALPDLLRARGGTRLSVGDAKAQSDLEHGLSLARRFRSPIWELQALRALAPLRIQQGRGANLRRALVDVLARFDEGHDTPDLRSASALVQSLRPD